jgi:PAS domain S-box-containing protein
MGPSLQKSKTSIASIVIAIIVVSVSVFLAAVGVIGYALFSAREHGELLALNSMQADQASTALAPALWNFDQTQVEQTVESFMKDKRVYEIVVREADSAHIVLAMSRDSKWNPVRKERVANITGFLSQERDIHYREKFVGSVRLVVTPAFLEKNLQRLRWAILLIIIVMASLLTLALYRLLLRIVLKPIKLLDHYAHAVRLETGETSHSLTIPFLGELQTLRDSIAAMIALLKSRNKDLQEQAKIIVESEAFRKRVFDSSRVPIVIMDAATYKYVDCNSAAVEIYRFSSREEVIGKTPLDFSAPTQYDDTPSSDKARLNIEKAMAFGAYEFEWRHERPDGEIWDAEVHLMSFESANRKLLQFTLTDITERKRAEERMLLLSKTIDVASDGVYWMDPEGKFMYVNDAGCFMLGYSKDEFLKLRIFDINPLVNAERWAEVWKLIREKGRYTNESEHRRKDGSLIPVEIVSTYIKFGYKEYINGFARDITERKRAEEALKESEEKFSKLFRSSPDAVILTELKSGKIIEVNTAFEKFSGFSRDELIGRPVLDLNMYSSEGRQRFVFMLREQGRIRDAEFDLKNKAGKESLVLASAEMIEINGEMHTITILQDITERKQAEEALRESEAKFKAVIENSNDSILFCDVEGKILYRSPKAGATGYSNEERVGKLAFDIVHPDDMNAVHNAWNHAVQRKNDSTKVEFRTLRKDGVMIFVDATIQNLLDNPDVRALVTVMRDITERKQAEEALRESEQKYRTLVDSANEGILVAQDGMLKFVNRQAIELSGHAEAELLGKPFTNFIHPDDQQLVVDYHQKRMNNEPAPFMYSFRMLTSDRSVRWIENNSVLIDWKGKLATLNFLTDITERKQAEDALLESEERFRALYENAPIGIFYSTFTGKILRVNDEYARMMGYASPEEVKDVVNRSSIAETIYVQPEERSGVVEKTLAAPGSWIRTEKQFRKKDGTQITANVVIRVLPDNPELMEGFLEDITKRKQAEKSLRESEERYRRLLESVTGYVYTVDVREGRSVATRHSPSCFWVTGYQPEEFALNPNLWISMVPGEDRSAVVAAVNKVLHESSPVSLEHRITHKSGGVRWVSAILVPHLDQNGILESYDGLISDVTERKTAEDALLESEDRFRQMAENIEEIFFLYQKDGNKLLYMSPAVTKLFGVDLDVIKADPQIIDRAVHPDDVAKVKFTHYETFYSTPLNEEFRAVAPDGSVHWMRLRSFPIQDLHGNVLRVAGLVADITEFKKAQEETVRQQQQLIQADKMASLGVMVSGIAHEINNPNNFITMSMPLLRQAWESILPVVEQYEKQGGALKIGSMDYAEFMQNFDQLMNGITEGSKRIKRIVSDLKDYARIETMDMNRMFDLNEVTQSAVNLMNNMIRKRTKTFSLELFKNRLPVKGNAQRLEQVIVNLIHNACDALTSSEQSISITTDVRGNNRTALVVTDHGCGIAPEDLSKITDPFYTTKRETGGTGLGLSISAGIVKDHGGELQFQSEPGKGTTVTLILPIGAQVK